MSFWAKIATAVNDMAVFKAACEKHDISFTEIAKSENRQYMGHPLRGTLRDNKGHGSGYLVEEDGAMHLMIDNDARYSSITHRCGANGGVMMRDYSVGVIEKSVSEAGGYVSDAQEQADGSVVLKISTYN